MDHFTTHGLTTYSPPIVGVGPHSGDPHYEPTPEPRHADPRRRLRADRPVGQARPAAGGLQRPDARRLRRRRPCRRSTTEVFQIVAAARDAAIATVRDAFAAGRPLQGWEVDEAARDVIEQAGYGDYFIHRTGHTIGQEVHGNGANMDNLETHEERRVLPRTCFSIEPGIYLPEFGVRSEVERLRRRRRRGPRHRRPAATERVRDFGEVLIVRRSRSPRRAT